MQKHLVPASFCCSLLLVGLAFNSAKAQDEPATQRSQPPAYANLEDAQFEAVLAKSEKEITAAEEVIHAKRDEWSRLPVAKKREFPIGDKVHLQGEANTAWYKYRQRERKAYLQLTRDPESARAAADEFLGEYIALACQQWQAKSPAEIRKLADRAIELGSTDPLVKAFREGVSAGEIGASGRTVGASKTLDDLLRDPRMDRYPAAVKYLISLWQFVAAKQAKDPAVSTRRYAAIDALVKLCKADRNYENQRCVSFLVGYLWFQLDRHEQRELLAALLSSENVDPWLVHTYVFYFLRLVAWDARGTGSASSVSEEGWRVFQKNVARAARHALFAWHLHPEYPEAATEMISLSRDGGDAQWGPRDWFQQAISAEFDHAQAYENYDWCLRPRWGGSYRQMIDFANECIGTKRYDTGVPARGVRTVFNIFSELGPDQPLGSTFPELGKLFRQLYEEQMAAYQANQTHWWLTVDDLGLIFWILTQTGEFDTARKFIDQWNEYLRRDELFSGSGQKGSFVIGRVAALTGPAATKAKEIDLTYSTWIDIESEERPPLDKAVALVDEAAKLDADSRAQLYFADVRKAFLQMQQFESGDWVNLEFNESMDGWHIIAKNAVVQGPDEVRLKAESSQQRIQARLLARFRPPFEVEAELEVLGQPVNRPYGGHGGIIIGSPDDPFRYAWRGEFRTIQIQLGTPQLLIYEMERGRQHRWIGTQSENDQEPKKLHRLRVAIWPNRVQYWQDGSMVKSSDSSQPITGRITFGQWNRGGSVTELRLTNARLRKMPLDPPPDPND